MTKVTVSAVVQIVDDEECLLGERETKAVRIELN